MFVRPAKVKTGIAILVLPPHTVLAQYVGATKEKNLRRECFLLS